jgi:hypothetical protein
LTDALREIADFGLRFIMHELESRSFRLNFFSGKLILRSLAMSRVIAEVHWDADQPFRVIDEIPSQATELATLELEHDLEDEERDATPEVNQIFDRAVSLQPTSPRPIVVAVEDRQVRFFAQN